MELRHQRYFIAVAEELHFGRAASRLLISQPALSKQIRELEEEVGAQLIWRTKRVVRLTPAGVSFLQNAREALGHAERSITEARSIGRGELGSLEIGYLPSAGLRIVPQVVRAFKKRHPKVDLRLRLAVPPHHLAEVRHNHVDFLFIGHPLEASDLVVQKVCEERMILAMPEGHALARQREIPIAALDEVPLVMWPRHLGPDSYDRILGLFKKAGARLNTVMETFPFINLVCAAACGIGVCFVPECAQDNPQKGVVYRNLRAPRPTLEWRLVYQPNQVGGAHQAFLETVRDTIGSGQG